MWIIKQDCRSATCQLAWLADTASLVLKWISITVTHSKQALLYCPRWPLPGTEALRCLVAPLNQLRKIAYLKWKSMFRFTEAWHLPALSQAIKIDEVFTASSLFPEFSVAHDHFLCWLFVWFEVRKRKIVENTVTFPETCLPRSKNLDQLHQQQYI